MTSRPVIILDFDGTVALGDGPVLAYARAVERLAGLPAGFAAGIADAVEASEHAGDALGDGAIDGYDLVRIAAESAGVAPETLGEAYLASRELLGGPDAPVAAPGGLAGFLVEAAGAGAERILLTNAPVTRIAATLDAIGLGGCFDRILTDAAKPSGLARLLDELDAETGEPAETGAPAEAFGHVGGPSVRSILCIGDIWRNDLAPAHERGHATALVGRYPDASARPTHRADRLETLLPALHGWLEASAVPEPVTAVPASFTATAPSTSEE